MSNSYKNYVGYLFFAFFASGAFIPLITKYFKGIGLTGTEIGAIMGTMSLVTIVCQPLWGMVADRKNDKKAVLNLCLFASGIAMLFMPFAKTFYLILPVLMTVYVFQSAIFPMTDTIALESEYDYGKIRQWGSFGFAVAVFISGLIAQKIGLWTIFYTYSITSAVAYFFLKPINTKAKSSKPIDIHDVKGLFKNRNYMLIVMCAFFVFGVFFSNNVFFGLFYEKIGGSIAGIGLAFLLFAGSEAPFLKVSGLLINKLGVKGTIVMAIIVSSLRMVFYYSLPSPMLVIALFMLQGLSVGTFMPAAAAFIADNTKQEVRTTAMALYASLGAGMGGMTCNYVGGIILDRFGVEYVYLFFALFTLMGIVSLMFTTHEKRVSEIEVL